MIIHVQFLVTLYLPVLLQVGSSRASWRTICVSCWIRCPTQVKERFVTQSNIHIRVRNIPYVFINCTMEISNPKGVIPPVTCICMKYVSNKHHPTHIHTFLQITGINQLSGHLLWEVVRLGWLAAFWASRRRGWTSRVDLMSINFMVNH